MIRKLATAGTVATTLIFSSALCHAGDFPATPLNPGPPTNLPGQHVIPGADLALGVFNGVTQPLVQPILVPGVSPSAPVAAPVKRHRRHLVARRVRHKTA